MKVHFYYIVIAATLLFAGCTKENPVKNNELYSFEVYPEDVATEVSIGNYDSTSKKYPVSWSQDHINFYSFQVMPTVVSKSMCSGIADWGEFSTTEEGNSSATFIGTRPKDEDLSGKDGYYFGFFPYKADRIIKSDSYNSTYRYYADDFEISATQDGTCSKYCIGCIWYDNIGFDGYTATKTYKAKVQNGVISFGTSQPVTKVEISSYNVPKDNIGTATALHDYIETNGTSIVLKLWGTGIKMLGSWTTKTGPGAMSGGSTNQCTIEKSDNAAFSSALVACRQTNGTATAPTVLVFTLTPSDTDNYAVTTRYVVLARTVDNTTTLYNIANSYVTNIGTLALNRKSEE